MPTIPEQIMDGILIPELRYTAGGYSAVLYDNNGKFGYDRENTFTVNTKILITNSKPFFEITPKSLGNGSMIAASDNINDVPTNYDRNRVSYTYNSKIVYYSKYFYNPCITEPPYNYNVSEVKWDYTPDEQDRIAWLMVYGDNIPDGYNVSYDLVGCKAAENNPVKIPPNSNVTNFDFELDANFAFNSGSVWIDGEGAEEGTPIEFYWEPETGHLKIWTVKSDVVIHVHATSDPYSNIDGEGAIPGGGSVGVPGVPGITATSSGIIGLFAPSVEQMRQLADYMWTDFGGDGTTTEDILKEIVQALKRSISNPLDYVIGLNIIPSAGLSIGGNSTIRFGFVSSDVSMPRLTNQYFTVDCGSLSFDALCGDTFLDYAPYSKFSIYLPYIGVKDVDANDFVGHTISVMYRGDVVTGGVTAYILKDGSVMYQYSGCCALNIPLTADGWG